MSEIDAMKALEDAFKNLDADAQERVLVWATSKFAKAVKVAQQPAADSPPGPGKVPASSSKKKKSSAPASSGKKAVLTMDKALNLTPSGKKSAATFMRSISLNPVTASRMTTSQPTTKVVAAR